MWAAILKWVMGTGIGAIGEQLNRAYENRLKAQNDADRLAADLVIKQLEADAEVARGAREIRMATAGFWEMRALTFLIALPFVVHVNLVGLDTNFRFGWGIPAFPKPFDEWEGAILLSFFGIYTVGKGVQSIASAIASRGRK